MFSKQNKTKQKDQFIDPKSNTNLFEKFYLMLYSMGVFIIITFVIFAVEFGRQSKLCIRNLYIIVHG